MFKIQNKNRKKHDILLFMFFLFLYEILLNFINVKKIFPLSENMIYICEKNQIKLKLNIKKILKSFYYHNIFIITISLNTNYFSVIQIQLK